MAVYPVKATISVFVLLFLFSCVNNMKDKKQNITELKNLSPSEIRQIMAKDRHRPVYHFIAPYNWMNDPHGVIQFNGRYHLFYQYNPDNPCWGNIHWGHAVSTDLVHWEDMPVALAPDAGGPDENGCWSGSSVKSGDEVMIFYTGAKYTVPDDQYRGGDQADESVCIALSNEDLRTWTKYENNPVLKEPHEQGGIEHWRDPYVFNDNGRWKMIIASGSETEGAAIMMYKSEDLYTWKKCAPLIEFDKSFGTFVETPSFFRLGSKYVLTLGSRSYSYITGDYNNGIFIPDVFGRLDYGEEIFYSPYVMRGDSYRNILFGWIRESDWTWEGRNNKNLSSPGWAGVISLPRLLSISDKNTLEFRPVPELETLRKENRHAENLVLESGTEQKLPGSGYCAEVLAEFDLSNADGIYMELGCSPDDNEKIIINYMKKTNTLNIQSKHYSRFGTGKSLNLYKAELELTENKILNLHIFLDHSVAEVFANYEKVITCRYYPGDMSDGSIKAGSVNGDAVLVSYDIWNIENIWPG
jgi:beta-fructofuranosidase